MYVVSLLIREFLQLSEEYRDSSRTYIEIDLLLYSSCWNQLDQALNITCIIFVCILKLTLP
jgi:hypothetical protein